MFRIFTSNLLFFLFFLIPFLNLYHAHSQDQDCQVRVDALKGSYEGDCKRGRAHGDGKAVGIDTYEGEFRKGLPDGEGTYTWANGNVYKGEFKKGMKDGEGILTIVRINDPDSVVTGFWEKDEYIGKTKTKYEIQSRCPEVSAISVTRAGGEIDRMSIMVTRRRNPINVSQLNLTGLYGEGIQQHRKVVYNKIEYPWEGSIRFTYNASSRRSVTKNCEVQLKINQPGNWEVRIDMRDEY